jgi:hypothetical protein
LNINKDVGATHPEALVAAVKQHQADYWCGLGWRRRSLAICRPNRALVQRR